MFRLLASVGFFAVLALNAQSPISQDTALEISTIPLYDHPVTVDQKPEEEPSLTIFKPQQGHSNGSAVIIAPGGGFILLASNIEGRQVADWFTVRGFTAFVLKYRLGKQNLFPTPLLDAQRSIRLVRSLAPVYHLDPNRIGIVGFSAGGYLAAATATLFHDPSPSASGNVEQLSDRPDFVVLGYAWLNAMQPLPGKGLNYCGMMSLKDADRCQALATDYTPTLHVTKRTPPTFLYATSDDRTVPVNASVDFYSALITAGVPAEIHIFRKGEHGSGLGTGDPALDLWPVLLEQWLRDTGFMGKPPATASGKN